VIGEQFPRERRGTLARPSVKNILDYRLRTDQIITNYLDNCPTSQLSTIQSIISLGLEHEQQHQELLLMDIKHNFSIDPSFPAYHSQLESDQCHQVNELNFFDMEGGMIEIGHNGADFCFDNELPRHSYCLKPYAIANRLITNGEYLNFIFAGGYKEPTYWLSDGWDAVTRFGWQSPLYWQLSNKHWYIFTLAGLKELNLNEPVAHISFYEADAFARWSGYRLPLEAEWEHFVNKNQLLPDNGNFYENLLLHPQSASPTDTQFFGDLWEWTQSPYTSYPGYKPLTEFMEYNSKFMSNQFVLRGGSCVTPQKHIRSTYRNFFQPDKRWQFAGIRLASHLD
jgi:ergothioneine biosynthesis protein EgtB